MEAEAFRKAQKEKNISRWAIHDCSICGYQCGYVFRGDDVFYDSGCNCTNFDGFQLRSFADVASHYNMQRNPDYIKKMDEFWGFKQS